MRLKFRWVAVLAMAFSGTVAADALTTLTDGDIFKKAQKDIATAGHADLDALNETVAICAAVTIGQRPQSFECEHRINAYWTRFSRGRAIDNYLASLGGLYAGFDNNALNPTGPMMDAYKHATTDLVTLEKTINERYRQLDKN